MPDTVDRPLVDRHRVDMVDRQPAVTRTVAELQQPVVTLMALLRVEKDRRAAARADMEVRQPVAQARVDMEDQARVVQPLVARTVVREVKDRQLAALPVDMEVQAKADRRADMVNSKVRPFAGDWHLLIQ